MKNKPEKEAKMKQKMPLLWGVAKNEFRGYATCCACGSCRLHNPLSPPEGRRHLSPQTPSKARKYSPKSIQNPFCDFSLNFTPIAEFANGPRAILHYPCEKSGMQPGTTTCTAGCITYYELSYKVTHSYEVFILCRFIAF
jgi:hypothetical protein